MGGLNDWTIAAGQRRVEEERGHSGITVKQECPEKKWPSTCPLIFVEFITLWKEQVTFTLTVPKLSFWMQKMRNTLGKRDFCKETCGLGAQFVQRSTSVPVSRGRWKGSRNHLSSTPLQTRFLIVTGVTQIRHQTKLSEGQETRTWE